MLTEEEAKTKWCPFARQSDEGTGAYNRYQDMTMPPSCLCIASACMAWRWIDEPYLNETQRNQLIENMPILGIIEVKRERGFCGLAGDK